MPLPELSILSSIRGVVEILVKGKGGGHMSYRLKKDNN